MFLPDIKKCLLGTILVFLFWLSALSSALAVPDFLVRFEWLEVHERSKTPDFRVRFEMLEAYERSKTPDFRVRFETLEKNGYAILTELSSNQPWRLDIGFTVLPDKREEVVRALSGRVFRLVMFDGFGCLFNEDGSWSGIGHSPDEMFKKVVLRRKRALEKERELELLLQPKWAL